MKLRQRRVKGLQEHLAHVASHPLIKDGNHEAAKLLRTDGALCYMRAALGVKRPVRADRFTPATG